MAVRMNKNVNSQDIQQTFWMNWYQAYGFATSYIDTNIIKVRGLTLEQFFVLITMKSLSEKSTATEIAKLLYKRPNTICTIFDRMEAKGLVIKNRDQEDRRLVWATITPKGLKRLAVTSDASLAVFQKLTSCFSKEELKIWGSLLEKLIQNTKSVSAPKPHKKPKPRWE
jgi:DNA-binding MarR family transcriptional regulator